MRRFVAVSLALGIVVGSLAAPAVAAKKKKKAPAPVAVDQQFFLRNIAGGCAPEALILLLSDGPDESTCGDHAGGIGNEVFINAFGEPCEPSGGYGCGNVLYSAAEGLPLTLDATKEIKGMIAVGAWASGSGVGNGAGLTTLVITVKGTKDDEEIVLGSTEITYPVTPAQNTYEHEFALKLDPALDKAQLTGLVIDLLNRGASVEHSWYSVDDPASYLTVPSWVTAS